MTTVTLKRRGDLYYVGARGHATGCDKVCTAVSTLFFTLAGWLRNSADAEVWHEELESGKATLIFSDAQEPSDAFEMIRIGFLQLEKGYPDYVQVLDEASGAKYRTN